MGEQIRAEDWLPEGWKIEIRVRKSGKKDRYYTDPINGYIFRSLKDIDRYLLSGKLGKHVTKNKPKGLDSDNPNFEFVKHADAPEKKKSTKSNGAKKGLKRARNGSKREKTGAENSKETPKKRIRRPSKGGRTSRTKKKRESTPFFLLDPDQCEDSNAVSIPNLSEIIDSMLKEKEGSKTVYLSAPAIGSLLEEKLSDSRTSNSSKKPKLTINMCKDNGISSNKLPCVPSEPAVKKEDSESRSIPKPSHDQEPSPPEKCGTLITDSKVKEGPESPFFADLFEDPCIDFAIKTLTGTSPFGM